MPPLTLAILASVLHMQGADATIASDNQGVEDLLSAIRGQLDERAVPNSPGIIEARYSKCVGCGDYHKVNHAKTLEAKPVGATGTKPAIGTGAKSGGGSTHR